jgi:hypothetical protein
MVWAPIGSLVVFVVGMGITLWEATREIRSSTHVKSASPKEERQYHPE